MSSRVGWPAMAARPFYQRYSRDVLGRICAGGIATACVIVALAAGPARGAGGAFSIAVLPDTQNMIDYKHQTAEGFPFDASDLFLGQMQWIAAHAQGHGGDVVFVAAV